MRAARSGKSLFRGLVWLGIIVLLFGSVRAEARQANCRTFVETGKQVCDRFLTYWQENGELAQQGYPISNLFSEVSDTDGKTYRVQYFERAVFELHPENRPPYDVLLSLLGSARYYEKYRSNAPGQRPNTTPGSVLYPQTGKRLGGTFLEYWRTHGGLAQQGYPISDELTEVSDLDGKTYTVQYFERAVFELHPENKPPFNVLLSQLGTFQFKRKYPNGEPGGPDPGPAADEYATLRQRPLRVTSLKPSEPCPKASGRIVHQAFAPALGEGPVYPVGLGDDGIMQTGGSLEEGGWKYIKVLWIGDLGKYRGPVLVRGARIDVPGEMRFGEGPTPADELRLHTDRGVGSVAGWQDWPSYTRLRVDGCYAYQADGLNFSIVIPFLAVYSSHP